MVLTKRQLFMLIENTLREEEESDSHPEEDADTSTESEDNSGLLDKPITFSIEFDGDEYEIKFYKDSNGDLNYKVNDEAKQNKTSQNFTTLAGLGLLGEDESIHDVLMKVLALDRSFKDYSKGRIRDIIHQKLKTSRQGYSHNDIKKALQT